MERVGIFTSERMNSILERIQRDGRVLASELANEFQTSEDTIRRTLRDLANQGHCKDGPDRSWEKSVILHAGCHRYSCTRVCTAEKTILTILQGSHQRR